MKEEARVFVGVTTRLKDDVCIFQKDAYSLKHPVVFVGSDNNLSLGGELEGVNKMVKTPILDLTVFYVSPCLLRDPAVLCVA